MDITEDVKIAVIGNVNSGKCLSKDTRIMMFDGTIKYVQDVRVGDLLMGDDSTARQVLSTTRGTGQLYDVIPVKGDRYTVNAKHILALKYNYFPSKSVNISVEDFLRLAQHEKNSYRGYRVGVSFPEKAVAIDPYILGYWLGSGTDLSPSENYNLLFIKRIPADYKYNSREVRLNLLAGFIDSNELFDWTDQQVLFDDVLWLAKSVGFAAFKTPDALSMAITGDLTEIPIRVNQSGIKPHSSLKYWLLTEITVKKAGCGEYFGF